MNRPFYSLLLAGLIFAGCKKDHDNNTPTPPPNEDAVHVYDVQEVKFNNPDSSVVHNFTTQGYKMAYTNKTSLQQSYPININNTAESSLFKYELDVKDSIANDKEMIIRTPADIDPNGNISFGSNKWAFVRNSLTTLPSEFTFKKEFLIPSMVLLTINVQVEYKEISMPFEATLKDQKTGEIRVIRGKWQGSYPVNVAADATSENI